MATRYRRGSIAKTHEMARWHAFDVAPGRALWVAGQAQQVVGQRDRVRPQARREHPQGSQSRGECDSIAEAPHEQRPLSEGIACEPERPRPRTPDGKREISVEVVDTRGAPALPAGADHLDIRTRWRKTQFLQELCAAIESEVGCKLDGGRRGRSRRGQSVHCRRTERSEMACEPVTEMDEFSGRRVGPQVDDAGDHGTHFAANANAVNFAAPLVGSDFIGSK
jgi:hypothetical protein